MTLLNKKIYIPGMDISLGTGIPLAALIISAATLIYKNMQNKTETPVTQIAAALVKLVTTTDEIKDGNNNNIIPFIIWLKGKLESVHASTGATDKKVEMVELHAKELKTKLCKVDKTVNHIATVQATINNRLK